MKKAGRPRANSMDRSIDVVGYVYSFFRYGLLNPKNDPRASLNRRSFTRSTDIVSLLDHTLHVHHDSLLQLAGDLRRPIPQAPVRRDQLRRADRSDFRVGRFACRGELARSGLDKSGAGHASLSSCQRWEGSGAFLFAEWKDCL